MNREIRGAIIGMAFGDAYVNVRERKRHGYRYTSSEMRILHSIVQADYCRHKASFLNKALHRNATVTIGRNGSSGSYLAAGFCISHPYFKQVRRWCYPGGCKTFTEQTLNMLTPQGIAFWYMDDGSARRNVNSAGWVKSVSTSLATMCSMTEAELICDYFESEYAIQFKLRRDKRRPANKAFYVECNTANSREFCGIIRPYIIPEMMYKLSHVADLNSHECRTPVANCTLCGGPVYENRRGGLCAGCYSREYYRKVRRFREGRAPHPRGFYKSGDDIVRTGGNEQPSDVQDKEPAR